MTRLAIEAMHTAKTPFMQMPAVGIREQHTKFLVVPNSGGFAPHAEWGDGNTYGIVDGPGTIGSGETLNAAIANCGANASGAGLWGYWTTPGSDGGEPDGTDWTVTAGQEHVGPITSYTGNYFENGVASSAPDYLLSYWFVNQTGKNIIPQIAVNLPDGATIDKVIVPLHAHLTYVYHRNTFYVMSKPNYTWQVGATWYAAPNWVSLVEEEDIYPTYDPNPPYDGWTGDNYKTTPDSGVKLALVGKLKATGTIEILATTDAFPVNDPGDETDYPVDLTGLIQTWYGVRSDATYSALNGVLISAMNDTEPGYAKDTWVYLGEFPDDSNNHFWRVDVEREAYTSPTLSMQTPIVTFGGDASVLVPSQGPPMNMPDMED